MLTRFDDLTRRFVKEYQGYPVHIVSVGAGNYFSRIELVPGCSRVLDSISLPYSYKSVCSLFLDGCDHDGYSSVSKEMVDLMSYNVNCRIQEMGTYVPIRTVCMTAAVTTTRFRKGNNHAYVTICDMHEDEESGIDKKTWHLQLPKLSEEIHTSLCSHPLHKTLVTHLREVEDELLSTFVMALIMGEEPECQDLTVTLMESTTEAYQR